MLTWDAAIGDRGCLEWGDVKWQGVCELHIGELRGSNLLVVCAADAGG